MKGDQSPLLQVMSSFHLGIKFQSQPQLKAGQGKKKKAISKKKNKKKNKTKKHRVILRSCNADTTHSQLETNGTIPHALYTSMKRESQRQTSRKPKCENKNAAQEINKRKPKA
jgi:hypothetical protein